MQSYPIPSRTTGYQSNRLYNNNHFLGVAPFLAIIVASALNEIGL